MLDPDFHALGESDRFIERVDKKPLSIRRDPPGLRKPGRRRVEFRTNLLEK
jgi:hypothetical protein